MILLLFLPALALMLHASWLYASGDWRAGECALTWAVIFAFSAAVISGEVML